VLHKGEYTYTVKQYSIRKYYKKDFSLTYYEIAFNSENNTISEIRLTDNYLTIEYEAGFFELYDMEEEAVAARIALIGEKIMTDIILFDKETILIPIVSSTALVKI
jgi:hypothetical protein